MMVLMVAGWAPMVSVRASQPQPERRPRAERTDPAERGGQVLVWVDLDLPELASVPREDRAERAALRKRILVQQDAVMARLRELGATEEARIQQVRNALAVRLPGAALGAARSIPGVRRVRAVRDVLREPPSSRN
jgi:hypothetical protein